MAEPLDFLRKDPTKIHSWPYWATHATFAVRFLAFLLAGCMTLFGSFLVVATNPNMPLNWGWNTIEHVSDPVPLHNYAANGVGAMAKSGSWLALAVPSNGLVTVSATARVPVLSNGVDVLDVTNGPEEASFYSLESTQGVALLRHTLWGWQQAAWLETPSFPVWKSQRQIQPSDVLFTEFDESGLLIGARGAGVARNRFVLSGGELQRTRDWQQSDTLSSVDPSQIIGTAKGYWLALSSGGIRFADRETLNEVPQRMAMTPRVRQLSAAKRGDWATVVDVNDAAWFFADGNGWTGPWFDRSGERLASSKDVTAARFSGPNLWLGATSGLFSYNTRRRQLQTILAGEPVESLETVGNGVLAATNSGIYFVSPGAAVKKLDSGRPKGLQLSPSGDTAVYWSVDEKQTDDPKVHVITEPSSDGKQTTIHVSGWRSSAPAPVLRAALQYGKSALFATTSGCFIYEADVSSWPSYQDCSSAALYRSTVQTLRINAFDWLSQEDGAVLASGDGRSLVLGDGNTWTVIDPTNEVVNRRLTAASGHVYGLGQQGQVVRFAADGKPQQVFGNTTSSLGTSNGPFRGDLVGDNTEWRLLIVQPSHLLEYRSSTGNWSKMPIPIEPRQAVFFAEGVVLVTVEGSLRILPGVAVPFGKNALPFPPTDVTALAAGPKQSILVGGPEGNAARYDFSAGSWQHLEPLPPRTGSIVQIEETSSHGLWARSSSGAVFHLVDGHWTRAALVRRWALSSAGSLWTLTATSVNAARGGGLGAEGSFSDGDGAKALTAQAQYVWQPDPDRVVLVASGSIGIFDRREDRWREIRGTPVNPTHFVAVKNGLLLVEPDQIYLLTRDLRIKRVVKGSAASVLKENFASEQAAGSLDRQGRERQNVNLFPSALMLDVAPSGNGDDLLWVMEPGKAIEYRFVADTMLIPSGKQVTVPKSVRSLAIAALQFKEVVLAPLRVAGASISYGDIALDWSMDPSGKITVGWRNRPDLPVWGSYGGRLAVQCVNDIWIDGSKSEVVLATEIGIVRRSLVDYSLRSLIVGTRLSIDDIRPSPTAVAGGIQWKLDSHGLAASIDQTVLGWTQSSSGWRLDSDILMRVRTTGPTSLTLETRAGVWAWDSQTGRTKSVPAPGSARMSIETPAIRVSLNGEEIRLKTFDGRPAIENGRFFFDNRVDICGYRGALYSLVAGRAVVRQDGSTLGHINGAWTLPNSFSVEARSLVPGTEGIRLVGPDGLYELADGSQSAKWQPAQPLPENVSVGPFIWQRSASSGWNVSYISNGQPRIIQPWWSRGRFSWDDYLAVGSMNGQRLALATPVGLAIRHLSGKIETLLKSQRFTSSTMARNGAQIVGTLFDGAWLLRNDADGQPNLTPTSPGMDQTAAAVFDSVEHPKLGRVFSLREEWNIKSARISPLFSNVPAVATETLINAGRFIFDAPSAAAMLPGPRWFSVTGCGSPTGCLGATFVESGGALMLTTIATLPMKIDTFRAASDGQVFGLAEGPRTFQVDAARVLEIPEGQTHDAFEAGDIVHLNVAKLAWTKAHAKAWGRGPRLTTDTPGYPLFHMGTAGMAFSFDVLNTLAMDTRSGKLFIGTEGGLFTCPTEARNAAVFELARTCEFSYRTSKNTRQEFLVGVQRARIDRSSKLWIRVGPSGAVWRRDDVWARDDSGGPFTTTIVEGHDVRFLPGEVKIGESSFKGSNNAWWLGRRPFQQIVDSSYDDSSGILWLCDSVSGLFALKIDRLTNPDR